ncbi:M23 family metallopeptidase [bacterium]|nr:M23 family metallopeptidase [bacterium]
MNKFGLRLKESRSLWLIFGIAGALIIWLFNQAGSTRKGEPDQDGIFKNDTGCLYCLYKGEIQKDQALSLALQQAGVIPATVFNITENIKEILDLRKILPGEKFFLRTDQQGNMLSFEYVKSPWKKIMLTPGDDEQYRVVEDSIPLTYTLRVKSGEIRENLWNSMVNSSCPPNLIGEYTEVFRYDIDFFTETQNGDQFALLYEEYSHEGKPIRLGRILAAEYHQKQEIHHALFFEDPKGRADYYNLEGKSLKKPLLRSPLNYRRISSTFTHSRYHPILKIYRPHLGVDYAAAAGTPVVASGDGRVIFSGWNGGYGNFVKIDHQNGFVTCYGHLSKIHSNARQGKSVKQGNIIGYVGSTGLSTGPHLDYRIIKNGTYVNPLKIAFPEGKPVAAEYQGEFDSQAVNYIKLMNILLNDQRPQPIVQDRQNDNKRNEEI